MSSQVICLFLNGKFIFWHQNLKTSLKLLEAASWQAIYYNKVGGAEDLKIILTEFFDRNKNNLIEILNIINQNRLNEINKGYY